MLNKRILLCAVFVAVWRESISASLPFVPSRLGHLDEVPYEEPTESSAELRAMVRDGIPPPLCTARCSSPRTGPVCAFDATGTARTFATMCELEAVSCRESTFYAITSLGEC